MEIHDKKQLAAICIERLKKEYPLSDCTLDYEHAWQLLVEVRLAAQCTDARVNVVVQDLFAKYPNVAALAAAEPEEIEEIVRPCGLGRSKARDISACMRMLRDKYDCNVPDDFDALLELLVSTNPAMATCTNAQGSTVYYIRTEMSDVYAGILAGKGNPATLLAKVVRENSQLYPRPVPLDLFEYPPFDFTPEVVQECLHKLAATPECADIRFVESAVGTVYLYSTQYLDHDHAEFLAERADTGLILNP